MRFSVTATLAACCASAHAFSDSTPFLLFSTSELAGSSKQMQLQTSSRVSSATRDILASCPTDRYLVVSQPNLNAAHLETKSAVPRLREALGRAQDSFTVSEMTGDITPEAISNLIRNACASRDNLAIEELALAPLSSPGENTNILKKNDDDLGRALAGQGSDASLTVIYTGGSRTEHAQTYKAEFMDSVNTELKRQLRNVAKRADDSFDNLPLFEKYQYFTPGIFMAIVTVLILLSILYTGISAIASLEVPYGAFDKEMGPSAQKKQQ